ncbi:hypothetical protein CROQUDRAFT_272241 [Cronartium quercuum f. sp. fusiforme G11]|uniref:Uncharacterized protein n=1 Tax=Cronartium quercuum f. sp. fusiforme G11 TaxID=708437 RepID=A0A9P6NCK5_9BASI|nr:hypothetical protein CROQUDRAFT_272241 [Cronartium quercuum f. sp. fusiforme G11]
MANLIDQTLAKDLSLKLSTRAFPLNCIGFDGSSASGGLVTHEWIGSLLLGPTSSSLSPLPTCLNVTNLRHQQIILGLPWLKAISAVINTVGGFLEIGSEEIAMVTMKTCSISV